MKSGGLLALAALFLITGCSSFNRDWKAARKQAETPVAPEGLWDGHWLSHVNGHTGRLRCMVTPGAEAPEYHARYQARYARILTATYSVPMSAMWVNDDVFLKGEHDLGPLAGGVYAYEAVISNGHFNATYTSRWDHGVFRMTRPDQRQDR